MNAWLLTWSWTSNEPAEKLAAIVSSRRSERWVADLMELLVLRAVYSAESSAYWANRHHDLMYKAKTTIVINKVPHGDRIFCGHDPWLYGRKVRELVVKVEEESDEEIISWTEPNNFRFSDEHDSRIEIAKHGEQRVLRRPKRPLSRDTWNW